MAEEEARKVPRGEGGLMSVAREVPPATRTRGFPLAPPHRLFAIFDDPKAGRRAVDGLRKQGMAGDDDIWVLYGDDGRRRLRGDGNKLRTVVVRVLQVALSNDASYVAVLDEALSAGGLVIAVRARSEASADRLARRLRAAEAHSFAYGTHWDFVPVTAAAA